MAPRRRPRQRVRGSNASIPRRLGVTTAGSGMSFVLRSLVVALLGCCPVYVAEQRVRRNSNANRDAAVSNNLGLLALACANSFCGAGVNALDLWLSLQERCNVESAPQKMLLADTGANSRSSPLVPGTTTGNSGSSINAVGVLGTGGGFGTYGTGDGDGGWSVSSTATVCVCVWLVSVYAGFQSGVKVGTQTKGGYPVA